MYFLTNQFSLSSYFFWLLIVSAFCLILERIIPWRAQQPALRREFFQDIFFLIFNGLFFSAIFYGVVCFVFEPFCRLTSRDNFAFLPNLVGGLPFWAQFVIILIIKDFFEYLVHYQLHYRKYLWRFHRVHHSITIMDWIGNFRFHWMEIIIYDAAKWLPLLFLQADYRVYLAIAVFSTLVGHLNHSNLDLSWGKLRYVFNSPRMHIWHHDYQKRYKCGCNFAVVFSLWDWIFATAYFPDTPQYPPKGLGFGGMEKLSRSLSRRVLYPLLSASENKKADPVLPDLPDDNK